MLPIRAAPGDVDPRFDPGYGLDGGISTSFVQPNGKIIISGGFTSVRGAPLPGIARLNIDGTADLSFNPVIGDQKVHFLSSILPRQDGTLVISGTFTTKDGADTWGLALLNSDWTLKTKFGITNRVYPIGAQRDGKILVFAAPSAAVPKLTRLNPDGTVDESFSPRWGNGSREVSINTMAEQPDGKLILGGDFNQINGTPRSSVVRLNPDGSLDATFNPHFNYGQYLAIIRALRLLPDGKMHIGGIFGEVQGGGTISRVGRLNGDGSLDLTFNPPPAPASLLEVLPNGDLLIADGSQTMARFRSDGTLDPSFRSVPVLGTPSVVSIQPDGKIVLIGKIVTPTGPQPIVRLNPDGTLDPTFDAGGELRDPVVSMLVQPDGKVLMAGSGENTGQGSLLRLNADGTRDWTFAEATFDSPTSDLGYHIALLPDGKIVVGTLPLARLRADGSVDPTLQPPPDLDTQDLDFRKFAVQSDGKILVGYAGRLVRLDPSGASDHSFRAPDIWFAAIATQPDGKILGVGNRGYWRLNQDGSLDQSFQAGEVADTFNPTPYLTSVSAQSDGKVLIEGVFFALQDAAGNYLPRPGLARLNNDGSVDTTFAPAMGLTHAVTDRWGRVLGIEYGPNSPLIVRLNSDGSLDATFHQVIASTPMAPRATINCLTPLNDGSVLIGGDFKVLDGLVRHYVARLLGDPVLEFHMSGKNIKLLWPNADYRLESAPTINGPYEPVPDAASGYAVPLSESARFFRLKKKAGLAVN